MKQLFFISLFAGLLSQSCSKKDDSVEMRQSSSSASTVVISTETVVKKGVNVEVDGRLFRCIGGGPICEIIVTTTVTSAFTANPGDNGDEGDYYAVLGLTESDELVMSFYKPSLSQEELAYFNNGTFLLENPFILGTDLCEELGVSEYYRVDAGSYEYSDEGNFYTVNFN